MGPTGKDVPAELRAYIVEEIRNEALEYAGIAMASVKLGKPEHEVTEDEAAAALADPVTIGKEELTWRTIRAGETAIVHGAVGKRGCSQAALQSFASTRTWLLIVARAEVAYVRRRRLRQSEGDPSSQDGLEKNPHARGLFCTWAGPRGLQRKGHRVRHGREPPRRFAPRGALLAQPTMPLALEFRTLQNGWGEVEKEAPAWVQSPPRSRADARRRGTSSTQRLCNSARLRLNWSRTVMRYRLWLGEQITRRLQAQRARTAARPEPSASENTLPSFRR